MESLDCLGVRLIVGETAPPTPGNDNWGVCSDWQTPAEVMQWLRQRKGRLSRELAADARLWACPEHRLTRTITLAIEKCALWHHYGVRE